MTALKPNPPAFTLSELELANLMHLMDAASQPQVSRNRRKHGRFPLIRRDIPFKVIQPRGGITDRLVICRGLSAGGMCVLYPGYLHSASLVQIELQKRQGGTELIHGQVRNCRHLHAAWHAVGIKFTDNIFPPLFLSQTAQSDAPHSEPPKVDMARLKGSILLVDDQMMDRNLFNHLLKGSGLHVTEVASAEQATILVGRSLAPAQQNNAAATVPFDLIICDLNLGNVPGEIAITQIRQKGYTGPILVMTAETSPDRLSAALAAGGTSVFHKPYTAAKLHAALAALLTQAPLIIDEPLYSPLCADPSNIQMIENYVAQVRITATELGKCITEENFPQVRVVCQTLNGTGNGYGFAPITEAATAAMTSLDASSSVTESLLQLRRLEVICWRITAAQPQAPNAAQT